MPASTSPDISSPAPSLTPSFAGASSNGSSGTPGSSLLLRSRANTMDRFYMALLFLASLTILLLIVGIVIELTYGSRSSLAAFGFHFFTSSTWDAEHQKFGAWPFILGTLYTSFLALLIAVPVSIGAAVFLSEIAPSWIRTPLAFMIELLAAIPSVVYGLWGIFVLAPFLVDHVETPISNSKLLSKFPIFAGSPNGNDILTASLILAIMVTPFITSVSRDILMAIPKIAREGSYGVGATKWETINGVVLPFARAGIIGAVILGLGRALGETMAVTMVIGNSDKFNISLFSAGNTMASLIANEFSEASYETYRAALVEIALCLFIVTMIVNALARILVLYTAKDIQTGGRR